MELPCKYSEKGCEYLGPRGAMKDHLDICSYGKIECQYLRCRKMVLRKELVTHLKGHHDAVKEWPADEFGRIKNFNWKMSLEIFNETVQVWWRPQLTQFEGRTFILQGLAQDFSWKFWVTLLGDEDEANTFEVKMDAFRVGSPLNISLRGKIYSTDTKKKDVLSDGKGILELSHNQVRMLGKIDDSCDINYQIIRK